MQHKPQKRGIALLTVLTVIGIIGLLAGVVGNHAGFILNGKNDSRAVEQAYFVAYGGLQRTLLNLRRDPSYPGGKNKAFPGGGKYSVSIHENTTTKPKKTPAGIEIPPGTTLVYCVGESGQVEQALAGTIASNSNDESDYAVLANYLNSQGGTVDAFTTSGGFDASGRNPMPGAGDVASIGSPANLVERASASLPTTIDGTMASTEVDGDILTPDFGYTIDATSSLLGETQLTANPVYDASPTPTYLGGLDEQLSGGPTTLYPGHYASMHFESDSKVTLKPGDYYVEGNFEMWEESQIVAPYGKVTLHVDGLFWMGHESTMNLDNDPRDLEVILTGTAPHYDWLPWSHNRSRASPWSLAGTSRQGVLGDESVLFGELIAPESSVLISGDIYGRMRADKVLLLGDAISGGIHYFTDLGGAGGLGSGNLVYDKIWRVH